MGRGRKKETDEESVAVAGNGEQDGTAVEVGTVSGEQGQVAETAVAGVEIQTAH